ncbi:hypothetical protein ACFQJ7_08725 [Halovenus rubra]|uniref:Uncharacterized protein n=2 Tax=Halovenus rubra TaxID=869890 RepID=A0ABD5X883_9EURY|nr:hypothetical protein [Halovenus rubra]
MNGEEITLPAGAVYETTTVDGTEYTRGFGLEYIEATTGLTVAEIESILDNPDRVVTKDGEVQYIIGDSVTDGEETILEIIGGTIATASSGETVEDTCGQKVYIPEQSENDHPYKQGIDKNDIRDALKNPFNGKVWTDGTLRYYISQASNGVWHIVRTSPDYPFAPWGVRTSLLKDGEKSFDSGQDAEEELEERGHTEYDC